MSPKMINPKTMDWCERWYQKKRGYSIQPLVGLVPTVDLATCETRRRSFACHLAWLMAGFHEIWVGALRYGTWHAKTGETVAPAFIPLTPSICLHPDPMTPSTSQSPIPIHFHIHLLIHQLGPALAAHSSLPVLD
jgi:hypothetical protein